MPVDLNKCPVCQYERIEYERVTGYLMYAITCPRCHRYYASHEFILFNGARNNRHQLSGYIREINEQSGDFMENPPELLIKNIEEILRNPLIPSDDDIKTKQKKILVWIRRKSQKFGEMVQIDMSLDRAVGYAKDDSEFEALLNSLEKKGYITIVKNVGCFLTEEGWEESGNLLKNEKIIEVPAEKEEKQLEITSTTTDQMTASPPTPEPTDDYAPNQQTRDLFQSLNLHPEIVQASWRLFKDGHYADAIFRAFTAVNAAARDKAHITKGADHSVMGMIFSETKPLLRINSLSSDTDMSEQAGFKHLFMGATAGIRNPKAHTNIDQRDPHKTLHYLGFASILMAMIDQAEYVAPEDAKEQE